MKCVTSMLVLMALATIPSASTFAADGTWSVDSANWLGDKLVDDAEKATIAAVCVCDFNLDGNIDATDLDVWKLNVGSTSATWATGDANDDGVVNLGDLDLLKVSMSSGVSGGTSPDSAAPEPGSLALLLPVLGWLGFVVARRLRRR